MIREKNKTYARDKPLVFADKVDRVGCRFKVSRKIRECVKTYMNAMMVKPLPASAEQWLYDLLLLMSVVDL